MADAGPPDDPGAPGMAREDSWLILTASKEQDILIDALYCKSSLQVPLSDSTRHETDF